jgi:hypothetical protein
MAVACIALVIALGGTGYAAIKLPRNSVGARQLKANAVTSAKVRNGSLTAKDFQSSTLLRGPRGPQGPKGDSAAGAGGASSTRLGYASRDLSIPGGASGAVGADFTDMIGLAVPAGSFSYTSSSGPLTATAPSRIVASGQAVVFNGSAAGDDANVACQIVLFSPEPRVIGNYTNALVPGGNSFLPLAVSAGGDIEAGVYDVRLQCNTNHAAVTFHRGNLTVAIAPR